VGIGTLLEDAVWADTVRVSLTEDPDLKPAGGQKGFIESIHTSGTA